MGDAESPKMKFKKNEHILLVWKEEVNKIWKKCFNFQKISFVFKLYIHGFLGGRKQYFKW